MSTHPTDPEIDLLVSAFLGNCGPQATRVYNYTRAVLALWGSPPPKGEPMAWNGLTDEDRERAVNLMPGMLEGVTKTWSWLHFAKAIEAICREKNAQPAPASRLEIESMRGRSVPVSEADMVLAAMETGEWELQRLLPQTCFTSEANIRNAWSVKRSAAPYCTKDGLRIWTGATPLEALCNGAAALGVELPGCSETAALPKTVVALLGEQAELRRLSECCPELNLSNYGHDDVDELNGWAIEVSQCIDRALAAQPAGAQQPGVAYAAQRASIPCGPLIDNFPPRPEPAIWHEGGGFYNIYQLELFANATHALRASHGQAPAQAAPAAVAGPKPGERCQHCIDLRDGFYGSYAPPCPYHDDDGKPRVAAPTAVAGPWSAGELDGNWLEIDHKDHAGVIRIVWKMEGDARSPVCEARAMAVIDALNANAAPTPPTQAAAPAQAIGPCVICGSDEPFTGTCGGGDSRALCKQPAPQPLPASQGDAPEVLDIPDQCPYFGPSPHRDVWLAGWYAARAAHQKLEASLARSQQFLEGVKMTNKQPEALRARSVAPAGEYPALPEPFCNAHSDADSEWPDMFSADQMRAYVDADRASRAPADSGEAPAGGEIDRLRAALVYVAYALHDTPKYMLAEGITLIDGDTVRVSRDGWTVEASVNPARAAPPAQAADSGAAPSQQVIVDFAQVGTAGPFAVVDGRVSLPDATMQDLVHMLRPTFNAQAADSVLEDAAQQPRLKVRLTAFPESNGKQNWTALLVRAEQWGGLAGNCGGISLARGELWNRVAYEAECARFLLGERDTEPFVLDYGDDIKTPEQWQGEVHGGTKPRDAARAAQEGKNHD